MKLNILGFVLCLISGSYVAVVSWTVGHLGHTPLYLALAFASGLSLLLAAVCGIFSGRSTLWRHMALVGSILFGTIGVLLTTPTITMTMLAVDHKSEECSKQCSGGSCDSLCSSYRDVHVALFLLTLLESLVGSLQVSGGWYLVCRKSRPRQSSGSLPSQETVETFVSTSTV